MNTKEIGVDEQWKKNRKRSFFVCIWYGFLIGVEFSCVSTSLVFYLRENVKVENFKNWYSIIMSLPYIAACSFGVVMGKYIDRTRQLKICLVILTLISICGNLLYTINVSVWFLLTGRFLCMACDAGHPVISGEFSRLYKGDELTLALSYYQTAHATGYVIGPAIGSVFRDIDFQLGDWKVNQNNFIGIFMATIMGVSLIAIQLFVKNLSRNQPNSVDFSLKNVKLKKKSIQSNHCIPRKYCESLTDIFSDKALVYLIFSSGYLIFVACTLDLVINLIASDFYKWSMARLGIVTSVSCCIFVVLMFTVGNKLIVISAKLVFTLFFSSTCICILIVALNILIKISNVWLQSLQLSFGIIMNSLIGLSGSVPARAILFKMVTPSCASYCEGVRNFFMRAFSAVAYFAAAFVYQYEEFSLIALAFITILLGFPLLIMKQFRPFSL